MVARISQCDRSRLKLALEDRLANPQADELSRHLQSCPHCRMELQQLAANDECWEDIRHLSPSDALRTFQVENSAIRSTRLAHQPECMTCYENEEQSLDFLTPPNREGVLGCLGNYEIEEVIGRGGMGIVLKAHDPSLNRTVAIKVMTGYLAASAAARKRFVREAQAAAAVVHDHVIPIYAVDTSGHTPFLVMPYVAGGSLQDRLDKSGVLDTKEILRIALQTAQGLAAAHAQGLIHRDVKPANILLENGVERVRITDFGLARAIDDASQTQSGYIAGTPQYMSPEQARGEPIDARAGLFSLGSMLYAMCTGHPPFRAETTFGVMQRVCNTTQRPTDEVNSDIPEWLSRFADRLLSKAPEQRFRDAAEVVGLLERELAHLQNPTAIPSPKREWMAVNRRRPFWRRRLMAACLGAIALAILAGYFAVYETTRTRGTQTKAAATVKWSDTEIQYTASEQDGKPNISYVDSPSRFVLTARTNELQHQLILARDESGKCSLKVSPLWSDGTASSTRELEDNVLFSKLIVDAEGDTFCVNAFGRKPWLKSSSASSSWSASSSQAVNADYSSSQSSTQKSVRDSSSGISEISVGYAAMPWAARDNQNLAVLYRMHSDYKAGLDCRTDPNRCVLTIEDKNRWTTHKIALNRSGILEVDGQTHDIAGSTVSVTEQRGSIVIAVDNEEILSFN